MGKFEDIPKQGAKLFEYQSVTITHPSQTFPLDYSFSF